MARKAICNKKRTASASVLTLGAAFLAASGGRNFVDRRGWVRTLCAASRFAAHVAVPRLARRLRASLRADELGDEQRSGKRRDHGPHVIHLVFTSVARCVFCLDIKMLVCRPAGGMRSYVLAAGTRKKKNAPGKCRFASEVAVSCKHGALPTHLGPIFRRLAHKSMETRVVRLLHVVAFCNKKLYGMFRCGRK
jgi:hypothetical protein